MNGDIRNIKSNVLSSLSTKKGSSVFSKAVKIISYLVVIATFIFVVIKISKDWTSIQWKDIQVQFKYLLPAAITGITVNFIICFNWKVVLKMFEVNLPFLVCFKIQMVSQIGKYIPGKVGVLLIKMVECNKVGIAYGRSMFPAIYEIGFGLYFQLLLGVITLPFFFFMFDHLFEVELLHFMVILVPGGLLLIHPKVFLYIVNFALNLFQKEPIKLNIKLHDWGIVIMGFFLLALSNSLLAYFVINMLHTVPFENIFFIFSCTTWAFLLGALNVVAPSGIGVREGILVGFFSYIMPIPLALVSSVIIRILTTLIEWGFIGISFLIRYTEISMQD